ncbi:hypothetical protein [Arthrobacter sp. N199823]|uniref:hypothetical protein n=1 Tax=Arthrobacter sp. N199823 TaxID=2058895 RepID=UPI000CE509A3|nr:hypothetical protein [Arthrobacter sp. N199823]
MTEPAETNEAQNPLTKPKFIISAVVVALLVALGLIFALTPRGSGTATPTTAPNNSPTATNSQSDASSSASVCGLPAGNQSKPATPPTDTTWELVGKVAAPTSPKQYGPGTTVADGLRSCFAHSPTGALYAAANVTTLSAIGKTRLVLENLAVPSPERDALLGQPEPAPSTDTAQLAGFAIRSYSSDQAVIDLAFRGANGAFVSIPVPLKWSGGDWKIIVPATGSTGAGQIADLTGYIPWAGV